MTMPLWTAADIAAATGCRMAGAAPEGISGVSIDSRTIKPGELYVAIKGDVHDGHDFVQAALDNGAGAALVSESWAKAHETHGALFIVPDALQGLIALGRAARQRSHAKIIAVTGSAGKTGTKDALGLVLSEQGKTHYSVASFNNHWGVPLTLARFPADAQFGVFEIGMNHAGEITPLVDMVKPHVAIVTTIAPVHLAYFGTTEAIADAKGEIFSGVVPGGTAIINGDIPERKRLDDHARRAGIEDIIHFGSAHNCPVRLVAADYHSDHSRVVADIYGQEIRYTIGSAGAHIVMNSLAVLAACERVGADLTRCAESMTRVKPPAGRGARVTLAVGNGRVELIDESYNANPASMRAALDNLGRVRPQGRRIAVLGDMLELGNDAAAMHAALDEPLARNNIDQVFLSGPMMRYLWERLPASQRGAYAPSSQELLGYVRNALQAGDVVTIKGSLGSRMGPIVKALVQEFPAAAEKEQLGV